MFAFQLISTEIFALKKSDTCDAAHMLMEDFKVKHLPVVDSGALIGFVSEKILLDNPDSKVETVMQTNTEIYKINSGKHIFECLQMLAEHHLSTLAVIDETKQYKGIINAADIAVFFHKNTLLQQPGSIIVLQMPALNYSLAELSRIAESNNVKILASITSPVLNEQNHVYVSLKFNSTNLKFVRQSYERFGYQIVFANHTDEEDDLFNSRYNWLLKYINT
ncbi:MAG: CBS domain-containing protein [Bacteroidia bacterium]